MIRSNIRGLFGFRSLQNRRSIVLACSGVFVAVIAFVDWRLENNISFGFLYLLPVLLMGGLLTPLQIAGLAALCTVLTEAFDPFPWTMELGPSRLILTFAAYFGAGYFGFTSSRDSRHAADHVAQMEKEAELRRKTEEQLDFLISRSPASIFTLDSKGIVQLANDSAHRLLGVKKGSLPGQAASTYFPALASVPASFEPPFFQTQMECRGRREDGELFLAQIWFSTYQTMAGPRLAAIVFDASEELRDRAESNLQQILSGSKLLVSALCHEIRNVCGAIGVVHSKLVRGNQLGDNEDFATLGTLVRGLETMAGLELRQATQPAAESTDLRSVLDELRIVIDPSFHEAGLTIRWILPEALPRVWADRQTLLQSFLNITKNSQRAMESSGRGVLTVRTESYGDSVIVRFLDTGPGVRDPKHLFEPFQPGAQTTGLGLYLSRTFVRAFQGDIEYEPQEKGCCFAVTLALADESTALAETA